LWFFSISFYLQKNERDNIFFHLIRVKEFWRVLLLQKGNAENLLLNDLGKQNVV